jgi:hypothetical protein
MSNAVRVAIGVGLAVGVCAACSTPPRTAGAPLAAPIAARILPPFQGLVVFDVNQPAYVAVFDVRPYIGVEMIYPGPNDPGRATGGVQAVTIFHLVQADEERRAQATPFVGGGEDYLFLLASRTPLDLGAFADHPILLSDSAGVALRALPPYEQIDSLMRNVVRPLNDNDWDADVLILTPGPDPSVNGSQLGLDCETDSPVSSKVCAHATRVVPTLSVAGAAQSGAVAQGLTPAHRTAADDWAEGERGTDKSGHAVSRSSAKLGNSPTEAAQTQGGTVATVHASMSGSTSATTVASGSVGKP